MHLVFERSRGQFRSDCNILALAWTPYYVEKHFRQALFDYHQKLLLDSSSPAQQASATSDSRLAELRQRCKYLKARQSLQDAYDTTYGRLQDFGWLVIGNVGKMIGITLSSLVSPPPETGKANNNGDLIQLEDSSPSQPDELLRPDRSCRRQNYNLRGHSEDVILVRWNELYQKLATVDSKGNVLIWHKINDKFTIQTPFYNRTKSVADFRWSNDGKTALVCYTDSFILVGSSSGQRSWHSMLNLNDYHITCASWTPSDQQLLLGVSNGNMVVIDLPNNELTELAVDQINIRTMCWSSCETSLRDIDDSGKAQPSSFQTRRSSYAKNNTVVSQRRLSRDCSVFSRYRSCSQGLNQQRSLSSRPNEAGNSAGQTTKTPHLLAIDFADNTIKLYEDGLSDPRPITIHVNLESYIMQWSADGKILAVAGFNIHTSAPLVGRLRCRYLNAIKFYNQQGKLVYEHLMRYTRYPITAFTWAHDDQRILVASGKQLHCAKVFRGVPELSLLASSRLQQLIRLPDKSDILNSVINNHHSPSIFNWQSHTCPVKLIPKEADKEGESEQDAVIASNNCLLHQYRLPSKLLRQIDQMFAVTIRSPFDENWSASDIVWRVPSDNQRNYCTLICYASEREVSMNDHQYRTNLDDGPGDDTVHDQNKIFVLYVEFMGTLIPILRARRIGYLKPEFVIFDPDDGQANQQRRHKVSDIAQNSCLLSQDIRPTSQRRCNKDTIQLPQASGSDLIEPMNSSTNDKLLQCASSLDDNCLDLHNQLSMSGFRSSKEMERYHNINSDSLNRQKQQRLAEIAKGRSYHQEPLPLLSNNPHLMMLMMGCPPPAGYHHHYGQRMLSSGEGTGKDASGHGAKRSNRELRRYRGAGLSAYLSERSELIRIKSNIWGTKFKIINLSNGMIRHRSVIGSVTYKASILHLQPRQIQLSLKDMSNYCCLCSKHHHKSLIAGKDHIGSKISKRITDLTLLDLPNGTASAFSSPRRSTKQSSKRRSADDHDKVILDVGDILRVAPKPDRPATRNLTRQRSDVSSSRRGQSRPPEFDQQSYSATRAIALAPKIPDNLPEYGEPSTSSDLKDDILTLTLDQGDQVKVEISSLRSSTETEDEQKSKQRPNLAADDEFLAMNKTLKSIQTITKMIVDLSSRANTDEPSQDPGLDKELSSPRKVVKRFEGDSPTFSSSQTYIPPQAPVHRPRRVANPKYLQADSHRGAHTGTQSATNSPIKFNRPGQRSSRGREKRSLYGQRPDPMLLAAPLPPPPLPVPIRRRISSSAKRFIDGSLRSLSIASTGYLTATSDSEPDECEPLVSRPAGRRLENRVPVRGKSLGPQSQPCSPLRDSRFPATRTFRDQADAFLSSASSFSSQLLSKLKNVGEPIASDPRRKDPNSSRAYTSSDSDESLFSESEMEDEANIQPAIKQAAGSTNHRAKAGISTSVKDLRYRVDGRQETRAKQAGRPKRSRRKSICPNVNCCCAKEFKLNNRPPVWNESSQVYQLDFGGRVTQESAKNLQIEHEGNLALQFGRINRCTYTLDYKYPFNAVQAMAIALASLTQRLK